MKTNKEFLSVGELSKRSGIPISALHFYDSKGLIRSKRNEGNQRRFHRRELRILGYIRVAKLLGLSLSEIQEAFSAVTGNQRPTEKDWIKIGSNWEELLDEKMRLIRKMKSQLSKCIGCGCLSLSDCPLRNPNDFLAKEGSGPHLLL